MQEVRYFTKVNLLEANREAIASGRNMTLVPEKLEALPDTKFPVGFSFLHNDVEARCQVVLDENGTSALLDVPLETYNGLPVAIEHEDGSVEFKEPALASEVPVTVGRLPSPGDMPNQGVFGGHVMEALSDEMETVQAYKCVECGEVSEEAGDRLYECGDCGTVFTKENSADGASHRCPDCNTFSSKVADQSCVECQEGEAEEITAYKCPSCEALHEDEDEARNCCEEGEDA